MEPVHGLDGLGHLCSDPQRACLRHVAGDLLDLRAVPSVPLELAAEPAHGALVPSFGDGYDALPVEVGHDADAALAAPPRGVVDPDAHDIRIAGGIPRLGDGFAQQAPYARIRLVHQMRYRRHGHAGERHHDHLRLEEGGEVRARAHLPGHPAGMHAVLGAVGPRHGAVDDRLVLPDVEMPPGPLARVVGAALPVAYGAFRRLALPMGHPRMELVLRPSALLEPDIGDLPFVPEPHRPLEEPCQHACLSIHIAPPGRSLLSGKILPFGGQDHKRCRSATHHK